MYERKESTRDLPKKSNKINETRTMGKSRKNSVENNPEEELTAPQLGQH